jgi:hypothetical protein
MPVDVFPPPVVRVGALSGPPGPEGPPGPPGSDALVYVATSPIGGHVVVAESAGGLAVADASNLDHMLRVVGVSTNAAGVGNDVNVQMRRAITHSGWAFTPGAPVFLGLAGALVPTPPVGAQFSQVVGVALTSTSLFVAIQPPVRLT